MTSLYDRISVRIGDVAVPAKPTTHAGEYSFPEDPTLLSLDDVGKWMFSLAAWNGYVLRNVALVELVVAEIQIAYDALLQKALALILERKGKTRTQLNLEAVALNPDIVLIKEKLDEAKAEVAAWECLHKIYDAQVAVLSRELSRRTSELSTDRRAL